MTTAAAAISSAPSSGLSPHAAPFTLPSRPACAPPGRRQDGDVSRSPGGSFVVSAEEKKSGDTHSVPPIAHGAMKSCVTVYPPSTQGMHAGQPSSWSGVRVEGYPSSCSTSVTPSAPSVRITSHYKQQNSLTSGSGSKCPPVKIECPASKIAETNTDSCGSRNKLVITENHISHKDAGKETSFPRNLQVTNPVDGSENSQGTKFCSSEANPVFSVKPLHIPTIRDGPSRFVADDVKPDPSECSVDSPCWRARLSPFDVLQTPAPQSINQESEAFVSGQKQSSSTVQHYEALSDLQNLVTSKTKHNHSQSHIDLGVSKKSGDVGTNKTKDSREKELESANQCAAKFDRELKRLSELRDDYMKRSGLNLSAPDFVPSSIGKSKVGKGLSNSIKVLYGPCSSTRNNIPRVLKAIENLTEVLWSSYSDDEIELEEHDYNLFESVIENLQTCLQKTRKGPIQGTSDEIAPKAQHTQTTVLKSDAGKYNGSYTADVGKRVIVNNFTGSSQMLNGFGKNNLTQSQPPLNNFPKKISCEEDVYKNLWIEAERANCELKYQLKHTCIKIDLESSRAHTGGKKNYFQVSDLGPDPSDSYGASLAHPPILSFPMDWSTGKTSGPRNSQNLVYAGDCIQSGGNGALSSSGTKGYATRPKNLQGDHVLTGLEETVAHRRAHGELNRSALDGASARSFVPRMDGNLRSSSQYGSSDWEHVLTEEIGWS